MSELPSRRNIRLKGHQYHHICLCCKECHCHNPRVALPTKGTLFTVTYPYCQDNLANCGIKTLLGQARSTAGIHQVDRDNPRTIICPRAVDHCSLMPLVGWYESNVAVRTTYLRRAEMIWTAVLVQAPDSTSCRLSMV